MGKREDLTGSFTVTIDGKPFQVSVAKADGPRRPRGCRSRGRSRRGPRTGSRPCARARCGPGCSCSCPPRRLPPLHLLPLLRLRLPPPVRLR